jgi:hypothetical protein
MSSPVSIVILSQIREADEVEGTAVAFSFALGHDSRRAAGANKNTPGFCPGKRRPR